MDFSNSYCIVSGASHGLGQALCLQLLEKGAKVLGISRTATIEHPNYSHIQLDLSDSMATTQLNFNIDNSFEKYILINNAARVGPVKPFEEIAEEEIISTSNLNFLAPLLLTKKFLEISCNDKQEKFVLNIGTGAANQAIDGWSMYCSTKAGLQMFAKVLHEETKLNRANCRVLDIAPGVIDTNMQMEIRETDESYFSSVKRFKDLHQNRELQGPDSTAELIISNFSNLFDKKLPTDTIRNYM